MKCSDCGVEFKSGDEYVQVERRVMVGKLSGVPDGWGYPLCVVCWMAVRMAWEKMERDEKVAQGPGV